MSQKHPTEDVKEHTQAIAEGVKEELTESRRPWYHLSHAARILLLIYAVQLALFGLLAFWVHLNPVNSIDLTITREFQENSASWLKISMEVVSYAGSTFVLPVLVLLAALLFWIGGLRLEALTVLGLSAVSLGVNVLIKILVERPRPNSHYVSVFQAATGQSFPSGHVLFYIVFFGFLTVLMFELKTLPKIIKVSVITLSMLLIFTIPFSRIYLGAHWFTDVLGGFLLGILCLYFLCFLYFRDYKKNRFKVFGTIKNEN